MSDFKVKPSLRESDPIICDGNQKNFSNFDFRIIEEDSIHCYLSIDGGQFRLVEDGFIVRKLSDLIFDEFEVVFSIAPPSNARLIVRSEHTPKRLLSVVQGHSINGDNLERELAEQWVVIQEFQRNILRAFSVGVGGDGRQVDVIPQGHFYKADGDGNLVDGGNVSVISEVLSSAQGFESSLEVTANQFLITDEDGKIVDGGDVAGLIRAIELAHDVNDESSTTTIVTENFVVNGHVANGQPLPDPAAPENQDIVLSMSLGNEAFPIGSDGTAWQILDQSAQPLFLHPKAQIALSFAFNRAFVKNVGWLPLLDLVSIDRDTEAYAQNQLGQWSHFDADVLRLTDRGIYIEGTRQNWVKHSFAPSVQRLVQTGAIQGGPFVDNEIITWPGGNGRLVLARSEINGGGEFLALEHVNVNSEPNGTITGSTSGASASVANVTVLWERENLTARRRVAGFTGEANTGTRVTATAGFAKLRFDIDDNENVPRVVSLSIKRSIGVGRVWATIDAAQGRHELQFDDTGYTLAGNFIMNTGNPVFELEMETAGDEVFIQHIQVERGNSATSPIDSFRGVGLRRADDISSDLAHPYWAFLRSDRIAVIGEFSTFDVTGGTFGSLHDDQFTVDAIQPDNTLRWNYVEKNPNGPSNVQMGLTYRTNGQTHSGVDPQHENIPFDKRFIGGWIADYENPELAIVLEGDLEVRQVAQTEIPLPSNRRKYHHGIQAQSGAAVEGYGAWTQFFGGDVNTAELVEVAATETTPIVGFVDKSI